MSTITEAMARPASDIEEDVREFIRSYDPLKQGRPYFAFYADENGHVVVEGNVRSVQAHRVLVDNVPDIAGVESWDFDRFFDDETLRLNVGSVVPRGVLVGVNFGHIMLNGFLPDDADKDAIVEQVKNLPGVRGVTAEFY